ncbi:restriction endonuclease [Lampropedia puyangensis]|uniref:Restriction endonuclease n=1 Tax=Lampropedia puyangensis TaxID=1330072 RepID=A0A4V4GPR9_9BURK|nr:restriction endonuclease [Lampropedia puyangensis]THT95305.1 restriction endonuclease [Lampropedia puyangensis]
MLDFKELNKDGKDFELLIRELLFSKGYKVYWSGVGPDGGRDLVCVEERQSFFAPDKKRWLIQCKHNAHSGKSVSVEDLDDIVDSCTQHDAAGFILACSTQPSSAVVNRLEAITNNSKNDITAIYWDYVFIEQALSCASLWRVAQRFFPISAESTTWKVYATENPNHWVVNYKGYYFHLANRIGSYHEHHFDSISQRISEIESLTMPEKHFICVRSIYYDDKNGGYTWYLDCMYPNDESPRYSSAQIKHYLGDGYALEDGQCYSFDVKLRAYLQLSDHYDPDHYDYYTRYMHSYLYGAKRESNWDDLEEAYKSDEELKERLNASKTASFDRLVAKFSEIGFLRLVRASNARVEDLDKFHLQRSWSDLISSLDIDTDRFFSAWFLFDVQSVDKLHQLISYIPQHVLYSFRLTRAYIYLPEDNDRSRLDSDEDEYLFELTMSIHPAELSNKFTAREKLNEYFELAIQGIGAFQANNS